MSPPEQASEVIPAAGGSAALVSLRGPSSGALKMTLGGSNTLSWLPIDKRAMDVEIRARAIAWVKHPASLGGGQEPMIRWALEIGHGNSVLSEPDRFRPQTPGIPAIARFGLPSRGLLLRTTAREIKLVLTYAGILQPDGLRIVDGQKQTALGAPSEITIQVSFQPVVGLDVPLYPRQDYSLMREPMVAFPAGANEWRLVDMYGRPFSSGMLDIVFQGLNCELSEVQIPGTGGPFGGGDYTMERDRSEFADWSAIPFFAASWRVLDTPNLLTGSHVLKPAFAEYR